jgi:hypothetical protein
MDSLAAVSTHSSAPVSHARQLAQLEDEITELAAHLNAATYRLLALIAEFDARGGWGGAGLKSCAHWLNWKCGIALGAAREKVRVAHALEDLPLISAALRSGRLSYSKARALTRVATPQNEDYLMMIADHGTASQVERLVRQYRRVQRAEALAQENQRHALREVSWYIDDDGCLVLKARLDPEQGARVVQALESATGAIREEQRDAAEDVSAETPVAARRADALARMADDYLAGSEGKVNGGERCTMHIHTDLDTLRAEGEGATAELEGGGDVSAETSRRLACDCGVVPWVEDGSGTTLDVGRRTRSIPPSIRRALERRDGGCRFPGCTARHHVDAHHIRHWADGGETRLDNLLLLCRHHHRLVHEGGYGLEKDAAGKPVFISPTGGRIPDCPETRFRGNVFALTAAHHRAGLDIGPQTPVPRWGGETMDDGMAVEGLLKRG